MRIWCDLGLFALSAKLGKAVSVYILTEAPWMSAVHDGVSSWEAAYRIELWEVFQMSWSFLSQVLLKAFRNAIWSTEKENEHSFPQYKVTKVNPWRIICHGDLFKINKLTTRFRIWHEDRLWSSRLVALGPGCMSEFLPHLGNSRCWQQLITFSRKPLFHLCRRKWFSPPCAAGGSRLGGTFLFCIQNIFVFFRMLVCVCVPSGKKLVCKCILLIFCLESNCSVDWYRKLIHVVQIVQEEKVNST